MGGVPGPDRRDGWIVRLFLVGLGFGGLNIFKLSFAHSEIVPHLVKHGLAYFAANLCCTRAYGLDIFLIKNNAVGAPGKVKHTLLRGRHTFKDAQNQAPWLRHMAGPWTMRPPRPFWLILHEHRKVVDSPAEL